MSDLKCALAQTEQTDYRSSFDDVNVRNLAINAFFSSSSNMVIVRNSDHDELNYKLTKHYNSHKAL